MLRKENILNQETLQEILGSFSQATGLHVEAVNNAGETFFVPRDLERCAFCQLIRSQPKGARKCQDSYKRASLEAAKWQEPYFFRCHAGLVIWAVPIMLDGVSVGSIICGQVLMWEPDPYFFHELQRSNEGGVSFEELKARAGQLEVISPARCQAAADMLFVVVNHLARRELHALEQMNARRKEQERLRRELEERKRADRQINDYASYLRKERRLLQYLRVGDRDQAKADLQSLLVDLYTKTVGDQAATKARIFELAALCSRAAVDGGVNADHAMSILHGFELELQGLERIEEYFSRAERLVEKFLEDIFALADKKHLSLVQNARRYIMENYYKPLTIEDVAQQLFVSPSHLSRLFREQLDCTVNDYLTRVRIEKAVEIISKPEYSIEQVARAVGFQSQSYFAKVFRKYLGVTPLVYRNSLS